MHQGACDILKEFGYRIESLRKLHGLSRLDMAEISGLHPNTVANIERGVVDGSIVAASRILIYLGCEGVYVTDRGFELIFTEGTPPGNYYPGLRTSKAYIAATIGDVVKRRRLGLDASITDIAELAGVHRNTLANVELGLVEPSISTVYRIYRSLDVECVAGSNNGIYLI
jgi:transcriptional regulator with XRE-family HTH domain